MAHMNNDIYKSSKTGQTNSPGQREGQQVSLGGGTDMKGGKGTFG